MKHILTIFVFLLSINSSHADYLKNKLEAKELVKKIMAEVKLGNIEKGLGYTKPYLIIPMHEFEGVINSLKMQAPMIKQRFGETIGVEYIDTEEIGKSLMEVSYIQKFDKHLMRWKFYFYKGKGGWVLNTFSTDDSIKAMFCH